MSICEIMKIYMLLFILQQCHPECICEDSRNNTYRCLRVINDSLNVLHCNFLDEEVSIAFF